MKKIRVLFLIFLISNCILLGLTKSSYSQSEKIILCSDGATIEHFDCLKKCIFEKKCSINEEEAFRLLIQEWKEKDGATGYEISNSFLEILVFDPEFFFSEMLENQKIFYDWLAELENLSFVWFKESPSPLENKKKELVFLLKEVKNLKTDADKCLLVYSR